jgi:hypothetical protein
MPLAPFDVVAIFQCAVEYGCAIEDAERQADSHAGTGGTRIDAASDRLTIALGIDQKIPQEVIRSFKHSALREPGRNALKRLAFAVWALNGDQRWIAKGMELLGEGAWQL